MVSLSEHIFSILLLGFLFLGELISLCPFSVSIDDNISAMRQGPVLHFLELCVPNMCLSMM